MPEKSDYLSYYKNKTILVTGAAGYIGSSVIRRLSSRPGNIIALVEKGTVFNIFPKGKGEAKISIFEADIRNREIWKGLLEDVDILFHFAAQTSSGKANQNPSMDVEINLSPIVSIIETCQKNNFSPHIIFSGTVTQVGFTESYPVNETFIDLPITVYDINKLTAEKYLQYYSNQLNNYAVVLRLPNVYGPGPRSSSADRGILNAMIRKALKGEPLTIYGEGNFVRDYIYIDDVVEAFLVAGAKMDVLKGKYYIIGSGAGYTIKQAFTLIRDIARGKSGSKESKILHVPLPDNFSRIEYRNFVADTAKFRVATGWREKVSLEEGIDKTVDYYLKEGGV